MMTRMTPEVRAIYEQLLSVARSVGPWLKDAMALSS
jgi:hypothetical protein